MRTTKTRQGLTLRAVAGSYVVLLGMSMKPQDCNGHMGFAIHRTDHTEDEAYWLEGMKTFEATDPGFPAGSKYPTNQQPIQGFTWSDYSAKPGHHYTYKVQALKGKPDQLQAFKEVDVEVHTETETGGDHDVFFNRGAAASQEYTRRFGNHPPDMNNPADPRWAWLSRGAAEAIEAFIARAKGKGWGLRVSAYEFRLPRVADALKKAHDAGVDVSIIFDANDNPPDQHGVVFPRDENRATAGAAGLTPLCIERITRPGVKSPPISHHKFIVLLKKGKPVAVLTGSTNFSWGGVFGQANVVHIAGDAAVAAAYLQCWTLISTNPDYKALRAALSALDQIPPDLPPVGVGTLFSPQTSNAALEWYAARAKAAPKALFMTFAFGMNQLFKDAYANGDAGLRYALLDKLLAPGIPKEKRPAAEAEMLALRKQTENRFAVGNLLATNRFDRWLKETLTGLNEHVLYIHTKFMLIDPLGKDPIVISGSANFSDASTTDNDENMLVIRGDLRAADLYVGEYMRLWNHYAFREWAAAQSDLANARFKFLDTTNTWWRSYFGDTDRSRQRAYFSGAA
jgi:PLD-like domain